MWYAPHWIAANILQSVEIYSMEYENVKRKKKVMNEKELKRILATTEVMWITRNGNIVIELFIIYYIQVYCKFETWSTTTTPTTKLLRKKIWQKQHQQTATASTSLLYSFHSNYWISVWQLNGAPTLQHDKYWFNMARKKCLLYELML